MKIDFSAAEIQEEWLPVFEDITNNLVENGYSLTPNLLSELAFSKIRKRFLTLKEKDEFEKSGIGKAAVYQIDAEIRGDYIRWIDLNNLHPNIAPYYHFLAQLLKYINRQLYIGLKDCESHYAFYPPGNGYAKHRDRFRTNPHRVLSVVFYLNKNWKTGDGGELVLYKNGLKELKTIAPIGNSLAIFKSEIIHEVLPCKTDRYSLTSWLLDKELELTFL